MYDGDFKQDESYAGAWAVLLLQKGLFQASLGTNTKLAFRVKQHKLSPNTAQKICSILTMSVPGGQAQVSVVMPAWQLTGAVNNGGVARRHPLERAGPTPNVPASHVCSCFEMACQARIWPNLRYRVHVCIAFQLADSIYHLCIAM